MTPDPQQGKRIFKKLLRVAPELRQTTEYAKSRVAGFMDLNLDVLVRRSGWARIALSHYWKDDSGDLIADPDMELAVSFDDETAVALTYQDMFTYDDVYPVDGGPADIGVQQQLNEFIEQWLDNLAEQGHVLPKGR